MAEASSTGTSKEEEGLLYVRELGLTQIDGHQEEHPCVADVIFVHGLQGHPKRTWQSDSNAESSTRARKRLRPFSWKDTDILAHDGSKVFWPADILPQDRNDVRILTFGYDSKVTKAFMAPTSKNGIFQHGNSFLRAVGRRRINCRRRPIVFVAHSLGGLVVKQALIEARKQTNDSDLLDVYDSTHGIIFFGTPHRGSDLASWGLLMSTIAEAVQIDTNNAIIRDLDPMSGSSKLEEMRLDFDDILRDSHRSRELRVYSFQEEEGMTSIKLIGGKVVPNESSSLDSRKYGNDTIHANHMNMCRFNAKDDDGYEKFSSVLAKFIGQIKTELGEVEKKRKDDILNTLDFAERRSREYQLQNLDAKEATFSWIWSSSSSFVGWLSGQDGIYWISGKPGSGKSTLVDYLVGNERTQSTLRLYNHMEWTILSFFFDFRGGKGISNSFEGLLRSLLYQLIDAIPKLLDVLGLEDGKNGSFSEWHGCRLRNALHSALCKITGGVCIFVDGLDEYEGSVLELILFLRSLATSDDSDKTSIKVCVSSRPEPIPSQLLQHLPGLSMSNHNAPGIRWYCDVTLEKLQELETAVSEDLDISRLSDDVTHRAEGVFLWARFALDELIRGFCSGETIEELLVRLESFPGDLEDLYERMLSRIEPTAKKECMVMLQLVCFAKRSLSWQELRAATHTAMDKDVKFNERMHRDLDSTLTLPKEDLMFAKRLRAKAAGLLELVRRNDGDESLSKVKLIHKSVSTYLNKKGWRTLGELEGEDSIRHQSLYVETCTRYLHGVLRHFNLETWEEVLYESHFRKDDGSGWPFLYYAARYVFEHAKSLERHGASTYPLLQSYLTEQIVRLHQYLIRIDCPCQGPLRSELFDNFDPFLVAVVHGLALYCEKDLATRTKAPGQPFWERALKYGLWTIFWYGLWNNFWFDDRDDLGASSMLSLALQNVTTVQQSHLELALKEDLSPFAVGALDLLLQHHSVKTLRLVDNRGQAVTLLWLYTHFESYTYLDKILNVLIERAKDRGEDVRQRCGPGGNLVETLLKQVPGLDRREKLLLLRQYYESMSWPFEYDSQEVEREK